MDFMRKKVYQEDDRSVCPALVNRKMATVPTAYYVDMT